MGKTPRIEDVVASYFNEDKSAQESAADLGAIVYQMMREEEYYGKRTKRMAELTKLSNIQERVLRKILEKTMDKSNYQKGLRLKVAK